MMEISGLVYSDEEGARKACLVNFWKSEASSSKASESEGTKIGGDSINLP
jgi:hypothetical protein